MDHKTRSNSDISLLMSIVKSVGLQCISDKVFFNLLMHVAISMGNHMDLSAIIPKWHENPCDSMLITYHYSSYSYSLC